MFDVSAVKNSFGRAARRYDEFAHLQRQVRGRCVALAKQYIPNGATLLDAGCGTGALCEDAKLIHTDWKITGVDVSPGMCEQTRAQGYVAINADVKDMPFDTQCFDAIFSSLMLQWVNDTHAAFAEMSRVMKCGGHAVISTLVNGTLKELRDAFFTLDNDPHVSDFLEPHCLLETAKAAGFTLVVARQDNIIETYPDTVALMRSLQAIGASNKQNNRKRGLMTPGQFARLERAYAKNADGALPVTWQVLYLVLQRV